MFVLVQWHAFSSTLPCLQLGPRLWASWSWDHVSFIPVAPRTQNCEEWCHSLIYPSKTSIYWAPVQCHDLCPVVIKYLRNERGKGEKTEGKVGVQWSGAQDGWPQDPGLCGRRSIRRDEWSPRWEPSLDSGTNLLCVTTSLGSSFHRTFQGSSGTFLTGNSESFINWTNHVA